MVTQLCRLGLPDDESLSPFLLDAVHMLAIVDPEPSAQFMWNNKAIGICNKSTNPETRAWLASVLNNQGWCFFEAGEYDAALDMFKQALDTRTQRGDAATDIAVARWSVARCLRAMGDYETALQIQLELSADSAAVCEERAHLYRAIGGNDALVRESAAKAIALFKEDEVSPQRLAALRAL
ncbi:hypothetical protein HDU82_008365 [Entophlyctis luteolus]|nr:hypothetical protein HDU82_008365 [Entophlyctis luteolus]